MAARNTSENVPNASKGGEEVNSKDETETEAEAKAGAAVVAGAETNDVHTTYKSMIISTKARSN
jgi:hypothetical protein